MDAGGSGGRLRRPAVVEPEPAAGYSGEWCPIAVPGVCGLGNMVPGDTSAAVADAAVAAAGRQRLVTAVGWELVLTACCGVHRRRQ